MGDGKGGDDGGGGWGSGCGGGGGKAAQLEKVEVGFVEQVGGVAPCVEEEDAFFSCFVVGNAVVVYAIDGRAGGEGEKGCEGGQGRKRVESRFELVFQLGDIFVWREGHARIRLQ